MKNKTLTFRPSNRNKNLLIEIEKFAKKDNRTLNNFIEKILLDYLNNIKNI